MERNTQTTLQQLSTGDRFYKLADKKRTVIEVTGSNSQQGQTGGNAYNIECVPDGHNPKYPVNIKSNTEVIFLRHTQK